MRTMAILYVSILMTIMSLGIICVLTMKSSYAETIRDNLDDSIVYSVKLLQVDRDNSWVNKLDPDNDDSRYTYPAQNIDWVSGYQDRDVEDSVDKFKTDFVRYLTANLDTRVSDVEVTFYGVDNNAGALSVKVIANFTYPSGQKGSVESYKTVILNKYVKDDVFTRNNE